ncbi:hypothetical protein [Rivihabitans pingtungensis]|uniref:hypothetical protein n=1 Tax=Rivihabitans pingtungensis TaxID=1054498 RepID=UPI00235739BA|nr:hypothetical protein [Rivihabitans pingtungensis]MCK6437004.1 hypothetical protein [Rivihabitans pingtungensis]
MRKNTTGKPAESQQAVLSEIGAWGKAFAAQSAISVAHKTQRSALGEVLDRRQYKQYGKAAQRPQEAAL